MSPAMHEFLPNSYGLGDYAYYTACYLALPSLAGKTGSLPNDKTTRQRDMFEDPDAHTAFCEVLDPSSLVISNKQRSRFTRAMKRLNTAPWYHLSQLEPHITHPIEDDDLMDVCSCRMGECPGACLDLHSWDRPHYLEQVIESRSKGDTQTQPALFTRLTLIYRAGERVVAETHDACCIRYNIAV
jgi:hypothetical protein